MPTLIDITGQRFGRLIVIEIAARKGPGGRSLWLCRCDCESKVVAWGGNLRSGNTKSCGCLRREVSYENHFIHGEGKSGKTTSEYHSWQAMRARCLDPNNRAYKWYGGRGIRVCARWLKFENFLADMRRRPAGRSLDRINNDGDYEPSNCRWATPKQ